MANGLAGGIERGLGGLAAGIKARRQSQNDEEARNLAAQFLAQYQKSGGQIPQNDTTGLSALIGQPNAASLLNIFQPQAATPDKEIDTYTNKSGKRTTIFQKADGSTYEREGGDVQGDTGGQSPLAKLIAERAALPAGSPHIAIYDDAIKRASQGTGSYGTLVGPDYQYYGRDNHTGQVTGPLGISHPPPVGGGAGDKERNDLEKLRQKKTDDAYKVGEALSTFDFQILANPGMVDQETKQWLNPKTEEQFVTKRQAYIDKLNALQQELEDIDKKLGGTFKAQPIQNYKAAGLQITPIE